MDGRMTSRRDLLRLSAVAAGGLALGACSTDDPSVVPPRSSTPTGSSTPADAAPDVVPTATSLTTVDFDDLPTCVLQPETTDGPFPLDEQFLRRDITEGLPGHPVQLGLRVLDADCDPVEGAMVEIWHTDVTGDYSAFADGGDGKDEAGGTTFMRGTQTSDADGIVEFTTIWPGWYPGRCVHYHLRATVDGQRVLSTQLTFDDDETAALFTSDDAYLEFGLPDTLVEEDGISRDAVANGTRLTTTPDVDTPNGTGTRALLNLGLPL